MNLNLKRVNDVVENKKLILAALVIMFGSNTTGILNAIYPDFRASAFTALDAEILKAEFYDEVDNLGERCEENLNELDIRVTLNEYKIKQNKEDIKK
jgi:hypothetical protein